MYIQIKKDDSYPITFSPLKEAIAKYKTKKLFLITDENVYFFYKEHLKDVFEEFKIEYLVIQPGEGSKSVDTYTSLIETLLEKHISRQDLIVAFGGGVVGDLAGFVAATILRGIGLIQVPTTLLSMTDSSIGSKVGIDTKQGKNLLGAFKHPMEVIIDPTYLQTLPNVEYQSGMAEVIKAYFIGDASLYEDIMTNNQLSLIKKAIAVKKKIVTKDPFEENERLYLNFGHTFGHAIEVLNEYVIPHGYAVSMGMDLSMRLGIHLGLTKKEAIEKLHRLLKQYHLPTYTHSIQDLIPFIKHDKKIVNGEVRFVFVKDVAIPIVHPIQLEVLYDFTRI